MTRPKKSLQLNLISNLHIYFNPIISLHFIPQQKLREYLFYEFIFDFLFAIPILSQMQAKGKYCPNLSLRNKKQEQHFKALFEK